MRARSGAARRRDLLGRLAEDRDLWLASASASGDPYLVPLSFAWDGLALIVATRAGTPTAANLQRSGIARVALGQTRDVTLVDVVVESWPAVQAPNEVAGPFVDKLRWDPRRESRPHMFFRLMPNRIQSWREENEIKGRSLMTDGRWLK